eukprot:TRINITY_DN8332_c0_g2_i1.p1 TRINITY_DN8332_c0_g2~~TRINITY_DN8332_c0_g2_i1.p1  ORF type:complete len:103 (-),score=8.92 TRINITY_DN8332_c0_g2_i1:97-405(-)
MEEKKKVLYKVRLTYPPNSLYLPNRFLLSFLTPAKKKIHLFLIPTAKGEGRGKMSFLTLLYFHPQKKNKKCFKKNPLPFFLKKRNRNLYEKVAGGGGLYTFF